MTGTAQTLTFLSWVRPQISGLATAQNGGRAQAGTAITLTEYGADGTPWRTGTQTADVPERSAHFRTRHLTLRVAPGGDPARRSIPADYGCQDPQVGGIAHAGLTLHDRLEAQRGAHSSSRARSTLTLVTAGAGHVGL